MVKFLVRRVAQAFLVMLVISLLVFVGVYAIGNPVSVLIDPHSPQQVIDQAIHNLGLDKPLWEQYLIFVGNAITGDFGTSFVHSRPAMALIRERFPATLELVIAAMTIAVLVGLPLGLIAGKSGEGFSGRAISFGSIIGFSLPTFWVGLMLIIAFSIELRVLPSGGRGAIGSVLGVPTSLATFDGLKHIVLPALSLSLFPAALLLRLVRSGVLEQQRMDYVRFAQAKGLSDWRILIVYNLRNTLIPVVTVMGMVSGGLIAYAVVTETVFAWPGTGKLIIDSIKVLDRPVIVSYILLVVVLFTAINLCTDLIYSILDPRIRFDGTKVR